VKLPEFTAGSQANVTLCGVTAATRRFFGPASDPRLGPGAAEGAASSITTNAAAAATTRRAKGWVVMPASDPDGAWAPIALSTLLWAAVKKRI
jgi:hypothetical protein